MHGATRSTERPKRRWCQFSLRTLFGLVLLGGLALGLLGRRLNEIRRELRIRHIVVGKLTTHGATLTYAPEDRGWLSALLGDETGPVVAVCVDGLVGFPFTDHTMESLHALTSVEQVRLDNVPVTDAGLEHLEGLTELEVLQLEDTLATKEGVAQLQAAVPNCRIEFRPWTPPKPLGVPAD